MNHTEFAVPREHPGGYDQHTREYKMPGFLAYYKKNKKKERNKEKANHPYEGEGIEIQGRNQSRNVRK